MVLSITYYDTDEEESFDRNTEVIVQSISHLKEIIIRTTTSNRVLNTENNTIEKLS